MPLQTALAELCDLKNKTKQQDPFLKTRQEIEKEGSYREMLQQLRAPAALVQDPSSVLSTHGDSEAPVAPSVVVSDTPGLCEHWHLGAITNTKA